MSISFCNQDKKALFLIRERKTLRELLPFATALRDTGQCQVLYYIHDFTANLDQGLAECDSVISLIL
jgi:hypothetical protein